MEFQPHRQVRFVSPEQLAGAYPADSILVDVRETDEVSACAYGADQEIICLPYGELKQRWGELPPDRALIFTCLSGRRSLRAAIYLSYKGHPNVANLEGGLRAWQKAGLPVKGDACSQSD